MSKIKMTPVDTEARKKLDFKGLEKPEAIRVFDFTLKDAERFDKVNYVCAQAINTLFEKANKNSFTQDIKFLCWSDPEGMLVDKDQKEAIQSIWGIELQETEEEENE